MKLSTVFTFTLAPLAVLASYGGGSYGGGSSGGGSSGSGSSGSGASIPDALAQVDAETIKFNSTITGFRDLLTALPIIAESVKLLAVLKEGTETANEAAPLSTDEALALVTPVTKLVDDVESTINNTLSKKWLFKKLLLTGIVKGTLQIIKKAADDFAAAVIAKVPDSLKSTAQNLIAPLDASLDNAIAQFS